MRYQGRGMKRLFFGGGLCASVLWGGVLGCESEKTESIAEAHQALTVAAPHETHRYQLEFPSSTNLQQIVLASTESLLIGDAVTLSGGASVLHRGATPLEIGADSSLGTAQHPTSVWSAGDVVLRDRAQVGGDLFALGQLQKHPGAQIAGNVVQLGAEEETLPLSWEVTFRRGKQQVHLEPEQKKTLVPEAYASVTIKRNAVLILTSGTYFLESLDVHSGGQLQLDPRGGPVLLYLKEGLSFRGEVRGEAAASRLFIASYGEQQLHVDAPFQGTVVAPRAHLRLSPVDGSGHQGSFWAKSIDVGARNPIQFVPSQVWQSFLPELVGTEKPIEIAPSVLARLRPDQRHGISVEPLRPIGGGLLLDKGVPQGVSVESLLLGSSGTTASSRGSGTSNATTGEFTVRIESHKKGSEGFGGGQAETYLITKIGNKDFPPDHSINNCTESGTGTCPSYTANISSSIETVSIHLSLKEDDSGLLGKDDDELDVFLTVNSLTGEFSGYFISNEDEWESLDGSTSCAETNDGFGLCWSFPQLSGRPKYCPTFNGQYLDSGLGEDVLRNALESLEVPASFAQASVEIFQGGEEKGVWDGVLDKEGCIPEGERPSIDNFAQKDETGVPLTVVTRILTRFCSDPSGSRCQGNNGVQMEVSEGDSGEIKNKLDQPPPPSTICSVYTEDPHFVQEGCEVFYAEGDADKLSYQSNALSSVSRAAGLVSLVLKRDRETSDLALHEVIGNTGVYKVQADATCQTDYGKTSFTTENHMCLTREGPGWPSDTAFKYIFAHELGHAIQRRAQAMPDVNYLIDEGGKWGCRHYNPGEAYGSQAHCLQGIEFSGAGHSEGFAHFWASVLFNRRENSNPTFVYYKPVLSSYCFQFPWIATCPTWEDEHGEIGWINYPPVAIGLNQPVQHRNQLPYILERVQQYDWYRSTETEWDILTFLWELYAQEGVTVSQILNAYRLALQEHLSRVKDFAPLGDPLRDRYSRGELSYDGHPVSAFIQEHRIPELRRVGSLRDSLSLVLDATISEKVELIAKRHGISVDVSSEGEL